MQWATRANEAFQTLRDPLKRATYLLSLRGIDVGAENNTAMEPAFLMQQMEWREAIEDAAAAKNVDALDALLAELRDEERVRFDRLGALLDSGANQAASGHRLAHPCPSRGVGVRRGLRSPGLADQLWLGHVDDPGVVR